MSNTPFDRVSAERAHELQGEGYTFVDVRSEPEYAAGHPVGAYNVPVMNRVAGRMHPNPRFLAVMQALFASDTKLLVSCQGGVRSARAAQQLIDAGYSNVIDVRPGFGGARDSFGQVLAVGWKDAGLPVELETAGKSYAELSAGVERSD